MRGARWRQSLADGAAGTALRDLEVDTGRREALTAMTVDPVLAHPAQTTLFDGAPAVAFVLNTAGHLSLVNTLDGHVDAITRSRLEAAHRRMDNGTLPRKGEFDLIAGLTGFGVYQLRRHGDSRLLRDTLTYLVRLTEPHDDGLPGWWAADGPAGPAAAWPGGHGNLGIAHGVAGPLALLSIAMRRGVMVTGHPTAISDMCRWLDQWRYGTRPEYWWPEAISRSEHDMGTARQYGPARPSWCYGTPGLARAQQLAGLALGDPQRQRLAAGALDACLSDESQLATLVDVSLCHGWAGVLHTAWRCGEHYQRMHTHLPRLLTGLTDCRQQHPPPRDGLLTGSPGAELALHTATTGMRPNTGWDACLLLDG